MKSGALRKKKRSESRNRRKVEVKAEPERKVRLKTGPRSVNKPEEKAEVT